MKQLAQPFYNDIKIDFDKLSGVYNKYMGNTLIRIRILFYP